MFWSKGYFVCSIGEGASYETIQEYIKKSRIRPIHMVQLKTEYLFGQDFVK